jgi:trehalose 6-phosphate phosphatase
LREGHRTERDAPTRREATTTTREAPARSEAPTTDWRAIRDRASALVAGRKPLLVVSDFDGTLSPISLDPLGARIVPLARRAIRRLARIAGEHPDRLRVVVLSGRTALDVAGRIRVGGVRYLGNHGLEAGSLARRARAEALAVSVDPALQPYVDPAASLARAVAVYLGNPDWLFVELKGPSVAFHFRQAPDPDAARESVLKAIEAAEREAGGTGLVQFEGRRIVELRPGGAGGKGAAMERLLERERPGAVLVMGDDVSDAEAFRVVTAARERGELDGLALGIHGASETPQVVVESADAILASPKEAARILTAVANAATERER